MRFALVAVVLALGCGFRITMESGDDDPTREVMIVDDLASDFASGKTSDATVAQRGALEPEAFQRGLFVRAYDDNMVGSLSSFTQVEQALLSTPLVGRAWGRVPYRFNTTSDRPRALGLTNSFDFTLLYEGEVYLPAGSIDFEVNADDNGIVEIALDGTFGEPMRDEFDNASTHYPLEVPASGWYPIRAAVDQGSGAAFLELSFTPEARDRTPIDNTNTRVRITQASGLALTAFDGQPMFVELGTTGVRDSDVDFGSGTPSLDMEGLSFDDFAIRLAGQVRIDEPGEYVLSARASTAAEQAYLIHARLQHRLGPTHLDALVGERKAPCRAILITNGEVSTALNETARAADIEILQLRPVRS